MNKKLLLESVNRRLTEINDKYLADKAENNRLRRLKKREELEEANRIDWIEKVGHEGPYEMIDIFNYLYRDAIRNMEPTESVLLNKVEKSYEFTGGCLPIPVGENK